MFRIVLRLTCVAGTSNVLIHRQVYLLGSKIECYFRLFYLLHLRFDIQILKLQKPSYASFTIGGDFSGQGRWILREHENKPLSTLYLHLSTHHSLLRFVSFLPYGENFIQYSHRRVMLEGKKMIIKRLSGA
jgi:hypothetical protein